MAVSDGALRHGVLYDLLGRVQHRDMREATVAQFMRRYHVDAAQAERVRGAGAQDLRRAIARSRSARTTRTALMLDWAARLAEIGLSVAHAQYHKHSAYILSNADMPGFSRMEQQRLARIVLAHRGKLGKMQDAGLEGSDWTLVFALRIAAPGAAQPHRRALSDAARGGRRVGLQPRPAAGLAGGKPARRRRARDRNRTPGRRSA